MISNINLVIGQTFTVKAALYASNGIPLVQDATSGIAAGFRKPLSSDTVTYTSSTPSVASIQMGDTHYNNFLLEAGKGSSGTCTQNSDGLSALITALSAGTTTITVTSVANPSATNNFTVTVAANGTVSLDVSAA